MSVLSLLALAAQLVLASLPFIKLTHYNRTARQLRINRRRGEAHEGRLDA